MRIDSVALRNFPTPEGTPVRIQLADRAVRFAALMVDTFIIIVTPFVIGLLLLFTVAPVFGGSVAFAFLVLLTFFVRTPYFIAFELRWQGQTPGKRLLGIRVVDRQGGVLTGAAVVARNLIREVEVFLPLGLLISVALEGIEEADVPLFYSTLAWLAVLTLMPMFNRDRLRVGDMLARTWVVSTRQAALQNDLADPEARPERARAAARHAFTKEQLDAYGIAELQLLERLLRGADSRAAELTREDVCARIRRRIGWQQDGVGAGTPEAWTASRTEAFLWDYYLALRTRLEQRALLGDRRSDKHSITAEPAAARVSKSPKR